MAWTKGSLTIADDGSASGSGALLQAFNLMWVEYVNYLDDVVKGDYFGLYGGSPHVYPGQRKFVAVLARMQVESMHYAVTNNIKAVVDTSDGALQRTPNPNNADTDTQGPSAKRTLDLE